MFFSTKIIKLLCLIVMSLMSLNLSSYFSPEDLSPVSLNHSPNITSTSHLTSQPLLNPNSTLTPTSPRPPPHDSSRRRPQRRAIPRCLIPIPRRRSPRRLRMILTRRNLRRTLRRLIDRWRRLRRIILGRCEVLHVVFVRSVDAVLGAVDAVVGHWVAIGGLVDCALFVA